jgi:acetate---CoA ligase (ADP-forming)
VAVPAAQVPAVADQCIALGVKALQVFSAGFGEKVGGKKAEAALVAKARAAGMRILGPNSLGLFNTVDGFFGTFATALDGAWPRPGNVGVVTQSGAFGSYFFGMAQQRGLGFSHFVATGNEADVDLADCIAFLADDPATHIIVTAMEGCRDGRKLATALLRARRAGKRVLAMKVGVSDIGARAAATHTGALSGQDEVFSAVLRDCGAVRLSSLEGLVDAAYAAHIGPLPEGRDILVTTTSGGIGVLLADAAEGAKLSLPPISDTALADIRKLATLADGHNPVDMSAGVLGDLGIYARIAERALSDRRYHAAICYLAHVARNPAHWAQLKKPLFALRARYPSMPFVAVLLADQAISAELEAHGFMVFADPTRSVRAIGALVEPEVLFAPRPNGCDRPQYKLSGSISTELDAAVELGARGVPFAPQALARNEDEALAAAQHIGYPVVLKVVSPDIQHKTEAGGVVLGIDNASALQRALPEMLQRVLAFKPEARIEGYIVARQLGGGAELLVGTRLDVVFGPVIIVGSGGVLTELVRDVQVRLAPIGAAAARDMLMGTRAGRLARGFRDRQPADIEAVARLIATLSEIAWVNRETVESIEINPVLALADGAFALDALVTYQGEIS